MMPIAWVVAVPASLTITVGQQPSPSPTLDPTAAPTASPTPAPVPTASSAPEPTSTPAPVVTPIPRPAVAPTVRFISAPLQVVAGEKIIYKATATGCGTGCRYTWIADGGRGSVIADTQTPSVIYLIFSPGKHTLLVRATASNGLTDSAQVAITAVTPTPVVTPAPTASPTPSVTPEPSPVQTAPSTPTQSPTPTASTPPVIATVVPTPKPSDPPVCVNCAPDVVPVFTTFSFPLAQLPIDRIFPCLDGQPINSGLAWFALLALLAAAAGIRRFGRARRLGFESKTIPFLLNAGGVTTAIYLTLSAGCAPVAASLLIAGIVGVGSMAAIFSFATRHAPRADRVASILSLGGVVVAAAVASLGSIVVIGLAVLAYAAITRPTVRTARR